MNILVVSQYFKPETFIINDLVLEMESLGHKVVVLTGKPNYPEGVLFPGYKACGFGKEAYGDSIEVYRIPMRPRGRGGALNLVLNYLSFLISGSVFGPYVLRGKKVDVILVFAPSPITSAIPAIFLKIIKRSFLSVWVLDLWPQSLMVTKFVTNKVVLKIVEQVVKVIYRCCDVVLVQSKEFFRPVREISPTSDVVYFPNSFKLPGVLAEKKELPATLNELLSENFCIVFAGNIGKAQSVETIVEAAKQLRGIREVKIVFVGSGSMLSWIQEQKEKHGLRNIECVGRFDMSLMPSIYEKSKALLLTLNSDEILQYTLPWKTQAYMAAAKPIVGAIDGEGERVIRESQCGLVGAAEDSAALAQNIRQMFELDAKEREEMGRRGYSYFTDNFEMTTQVKKLLGFISDRIRS